MCEENYDDELYDNEDSSMMLRIGDDGKAELYKPEDFVDVKKEDMELIHGFIKENKELFNEYMKKQKISSIKNSK